MAHLVQGEFIAQETNEQDFLYFFTGMGDEPEAKLQWNSSVILLAIYIKAIGDPNYRPEWCVAENVFEGVKASSLCDNYSKPYSNDSSRSFETFFENKKRIEALIADL